MNLSMSVKRNSCVVAMVQMSCTADRAANLEKALERVRQAAGRGAQIVCLQELFSSLYFCQEENADWFDLAEPIPGPTSEALSQLARELSIVIVASLFERRAAGIYHNTAAVIDADGSLLGVYRKMHIPDDPLFYEKFYFTPGDLGFRVFKTRYANIGPLVCWDQWYPEAARLTALGGADLLVYPTAIGWHPGEKSEWGERQLSAWQTMQRSHAIANGVFVAAVNRVGLEQPLNGSARRPAAYEGIEFWGHSFMCDPIGSVVQQASNDREEILLAEIDLNMIEEVRRNWPFLRDRRIDAYDGICNRFLDQ
jgi:N-carbamoylputrescine amidase